MRKMADQSLKKLDAEQTCQEMLALSPKNTNINNPSTHSQPFPSLSLFVNNSTRDQMRYSPLKILPSAFPDCSLYMLFWPFLQPLPLHETLVSFITDLKNMNNGSNFTCTPGLFIFPFHFINSPLPKLFLGRV